MKIETVYALAIKQDSDKLLDLGFYFVGYTSSLITVQGQFNETEINRTEFIDGAEYVDGLYGRVIGRVKIVMHDGDIDQHPLNAVGKPQHTRIGGTNPVLRDMGVEVDELFSEMFPIEKTNEG